MNAFGYVRLSKWDEKTTSPQRQRKAIAALCEQRSWKLIEVYEDIDVSAFNGNHRPQFERMMSRLSEVGAIVFWTLDRLSRSTVQSGQIAQACKAANVNLVATDMPIDTTTAGGKFIYDILSAKGEFESATTSERSRSMVAFKRERGEPLGKVPYGWRRVGKLYEPDPGQQAKLRLAAKLYIRGETFSAIAKDLGFLIGPLSRMLRSQRVQDALPPELAGELAQTLLARKSQRVPTNRQSLLGGIARCGECGAGMVKTSTRANRPGRWFSYACGKCWSVAIAGPWLDEHVTEAVLAAVDSGKLLEAIKRRKATGRTRKASELEARLELLEQAHFVDGTVPAARYKRLHVALVEQLAKAQKVERENGIDLPAELARNLGETWPKFTNAERRRIIVACVESITVTKATGHGPVDPDRVAITWR
jgi:site-specific DNA recombinase